MANDERLTLSVDCGGLFLKSCVLDESGTMHSKPSRIETPYPLSPDRFIETIKSISDSLPATYRATIGMPGMIRHGVVISTPHYRLRLVHVHVSILIFKNNGADLICRMR